ncbi:MAG TPA: class I SAM-dependent methyltransferase [Candidatus Dormibacteraeota bacterium]|nr:class I SAM-dependent methyltransferase [Candidatus Dormibacteraeota bacterium]
MAGKTRTDARRQAVKRSQPTPFACWFCAERLRLVAAGLACRNGHLVPEQADGFFDLWPPDRKAPAIDTFGTPLGWAYDLGVNNRTLARLTASLEWGTDVTRMYGLMEEALKLEPGQVALDVPVGGGTSFGEGAPGLRGLLVGIDLSPVMLRRAARRRARHRLGKRVLLARGDATRLPLVAGSVDRVLCFNGLHVIPDRGAAMAEFARVLKPGGELVGTVLVSDGPAPFSGVVGLERLASFFVPPTTGELRSLAKRFGFSRWEQDLEGALLYFRGEIRP